MAGGNQSIVVSPLERVASGDVIRLQQFAQKNLAELNRYLFDAATDDATAAGVVSLGSTTTSPLRAHVINGLLMRVVNASVDATVDAGVLWCVDPDAVPSADDSPFKIVEAAALGTGTLQLTVNSSGSNRIDVIEVQRNPSVIVESDVRDVYDPATGLFTPTTVTKAVQDQLNYRIRIGTPGAGFPGTASGWLPIVIARVPTGTTTWDTVDLWDVRPLVSDLARSPFNVYYAYPRGGLQHALAESPDGTARNLSGVVEATFSNRLAGGNVNVAPLPALDVRESNTRVVVPGFSSAPGPWFLYACFPLSLPRWCAYLPASVGERLPCGFRGIPVYSQSEGTGAIDGLVSLTLPAGLGFGAVASVGVCVMAGAYDFGGAWHGAVVSGRRTSIGTSGPRLSVVGSLGTTTTFNLLSTDNYPPRAAVVRIQFSMTVSVPGNGGNATATPQQRHVSLEGSGGTNVVFQQVDDFMIPSYHDAYTFSSTWEVDVPLWTSMPSGDQTAVRALKVVGALPMTLTATVIGWELGP